MDQEKLLELLKSAKSKIFSGSIGDYFVVYDKAEMIEMYDEAIYRIESLNALDAAYRNVVSNCQNLADENERLHKELKKRRKEKKKWKRRALIFKEALDDTRKLLKKGSYDYGKG